MSSQLHTVRSMLKNEWTVFRFRKIEEAIFIGHLDVMYCFERAIRRAQLPIIYSEGFNPSMRISFASPLSLGIEGKSEYLFAEFSEPLMNTCLNQLNECLPYGLSVYQTAQLRIPPKKLMKTLSGFIFSILFSDTDACQRTIDYFASYPFSVDPTLIQDHSVITTLYQSNKKIWRFFLKHFGEKSPSIKHILLTTPEPDSIQHISRDLIQFKA